MDSSRRDFFRRGGRDTLGKLAGLIGGGLSGLLGGPEEERDLSMNEAAGALRRLRLKSSGNILEKLIQDDTGVKRKETDHGGESS